MAMRQAGWPLRGFERARPLDRLHDDFDDVAGGHDGVNAGSIDAPGILADAQDFEPDDGLDSLEVGTWSVPGSALTLEAWVYPDEDFLIDDPRVISKAASSDPQDHVHMLSLTDGDVASYDGVTRTIDAGDEQAANAPLDIGAGSVWAMSFSVRIE